MVVTRRTPVVPQPHLARNTSARGAQRPQAMPAVDTKSAASGVATASHASSDGDNDHRNGLEKDAMQKTKKTRRHNKRKHQKSNFQAFLDFLTKLLLLAFTIYFFSVCPQDTHLQSPICRGLTEYKRIVLDPYIIPPIHAVLVHPSVAPHIERAKPYIHRAVDVTAPILLRTQQVWNLHIVPQWGTLVVPTWNERIIPQWNKHVTPEWDKHVVPRIQHARSKVEPYCLYVKQEYEERVAPRARVAFYNLQRWQRRAEPYVLLAASKTKDGYYAAKPYAIPLAKQTGHLLHQFALFLREQRQKFVDPHVAKIWEKVKELSSGQVVRETPATYDSSSSETPVVETFEYGTIVSSTRSVASAYDATPTPKATDVADTPSSGSPSGKTDEPQAEPVFMSEPEPASFPPPASAPTDVESLLIVESGRAEPMRASESPTPSAPIIAEEFEVPTSSSLAPIPTASSSRAPPAEEEPTVSPTQSPPSKITVPAASASAPPAKSFDDGEIDLDAFYAELGLDEPLGTSGSTQEYNASPPAESDDEKAERLRLKAEDAVRKRADIEARQTKWETELDAQMTRGASQLESRLTHLRAAAAAELVSSHEVRDAIEELVGEGEKYIKGAEVYLKNLKGENRRSEEKLALWDRVAERVSDKFNERFSATEGVVNGWYETMLEKELQVVATVTAEVREVAEKGQLDLGLDYASLDDVTYNDWQRYHGLIATSERYANEAASIQNGTHPKVVVTNPVAAILTDLASEVQDVVIGFETRLRRIKRDGERAFSNHLNGFAQMEEGKGSPVDNEAEANPQVSILPVPHEPREEEFIPPVIIGRSQEEVMEALGKVEPVEEREGVVGGSNVEAREAASPLDEREMKGGAAIDHTEL